jgi:hypothetical protein
MSLDDKAVICSCEEFVRLKSGTVVPKTKGRVSLEKGYHFIQKETCVSKRLYSTGVYEADSILDVDSIEGCQYKESSN